ncbi:MAG TPA: LuxR C-terminal-related transcriptional regulator [Oculatellaceae cyanobacterium]
MAELLASTSVIQLIRQVGECFDSTNRSAAALNSVAMIIGKRLQVDRCSVLLASSEKSIDSKEFVVAGDYSVSGSSSEGKSYRVQATSELLAMLETGKPVPLKELSLSSDDSQPRDLVKISEDATSQGVVLFPVRVKKKVLGCLAIVYQHGASHVSGEIMELIQILAQLIGLKFEETRFLSYESNGVVGHAGKITDFDNPEEVISNLSKQLSWERFVRQIICKSYATLDRDLLLQSVVDGFGHSLGASRCLIVRTDGLASPMVTHEYVEPDISPLGLGRTGPFPLAAIMPFRHKAAAITDLAVLQNSGDLREDEYEYFAENGVCCIAGAPITNHGAYYGVIVILEREASRKWAQRELDMLELVASQMAVALGHCQSYLQLKDQLFNMNLLGNLTQQLTNTLELVSRTGGTGPGGKAEPSEERVSKTFNAPPLSLRELEVLKLIASGLANREIAQRLFLTESTVELHASRIRKKLKLKSRTALVKYACDNGLA